MAGQERELKDAKPFVSLSSNFQGSATESSSSSGNSSDSGCGGCQECGQSDCRIIPVIIKAPTILKK